MVGWQKQRLDVPTSDYCPAICPNGHHLYSSALKRDLEAMLANKQLDDRAIGAAVDVFLITGEWLPSEDESEQLISTIQSGIAARLRDRNDAVVEAGRIALWLSATMAVS